MMKMNPKVSIIIPAYNVEKYISRGIESCLNQTYSNIEIVIVDDGSSDKTFDIILDYCSRDRRIVSIHQENQGVSVARNNALDKSNGEYVLFLDSDDWLENDAVSSLVNSIVDKDCLVCCDWYYVLFDEKSNSFIHENQVGNSIEEICDSRDALNYIGINSKYRFTSSCYKLFNREILNINHIRFTPGIHQGEDGLFSFQYLCNIKKVKYIPLALWNIMDRPDSACNGGYSLKWKTALDAVDLMLQNKNILPQKTVEQLFAFKAERAMWLEKNCTQSEDYKYEDYLFYQKVLKENGKYLLKREKNIKTLIQCIVYPVLPPIMMRCFARCKSDLGV